MGQHLRAIVLGAGWAGEGHTRALQFCGVEVVAICARNQEVVNEVATRLGVRVASCQWRETLETVRPDIVAVATPASLRQEAVMAATQLGCHIFCDKPLAASKEEAYEMYRIVTGAGVKHAYAATHLYDPGVAWMKRLIESNSIGRLREATVTWRLNLPSAIPWSWVGSLAEGGGMLNNSMPHVLGILTSVSGGDLTHVTGEARRLIDRAPVFPEIHDSRQWRARLGQISPEDAAEREWRTWDADMADTALLRFATPGGEVIATVRLGPGIEASGETSGLRLYGEMGTLRGDGPFSYRVSQVRKTGASAEALPIPQDLIDALPQFGDDAQNKWCALMRDFVADIKDEPYRKYLTFYDGWRYQCAIDGIRSGNGWLCMPV